MRWGLSFQGREFSRFARVAKTKAHRASGVTQKTAPGKIRARRSSFGLKKRG